MPMTRTVPPPSPHLVTGSHGRKGVALCFASRFGPLSLSLQVFGRPERLSRNVWTSKKTCRPTFNPSRHQRQCPTHLFSRLYTVQSLYAKLIVNFSHESDVTSLDPFLFYYYLPQKSPLRYFVPRREQNRPSQHASVWLRSATCESSAVL